MASTKFIKVMGIILWMLSPLFVYGQQITDPVSFTVTQAPEQVRAGEPFTVKVKADISGNWHLYSINNEPDKGPYPTKFTAAGDGLSLDGEVKESKPTISHDPNFDMDLGWHSHQAEFDIPLKFAENTSNDGFIDIAVQYQVCNDVACLPPKTKHITQKINLSGVSGSSMEGSTGSSGAGMEGGAKSEGDVNSSGTISAGGYAGTGIFSFLWIAITAGLAALLTPCVFPMIPLTVSFFTKQSHESKKRAVTQALFFGLAIIGTFTALGVLLALIIGASGANQFASNPWVNLFIGLVLVVFAISLLGLFELRLPYQLTNYLNRKSNERSGVMGVLFMGLTISAVSFSCTAPFVGGVLAATTGGEWFYPIIGMIAFSAAFSIPFVLFALFPRWLESMPKSGSWMNLVKVLLGFIELAAAFKFISNADLVWEWGIVSRPFTISAWIVIFALAGLYTLGYLNLGHEKKTESISTLRLLIAIPLLTFSLYLVPGLLGSSLGIWDAWLPPKQATDVSVVNSISQVKGSGNSGAEDENWSSDFRKSMAAAREASRPVFIDFTGYTCTNCRAMEANVFPLEPVQEHFQKMERVRLYTDSATDGPENQKLQFKLTGTVALPTYIIIDPYSGKILTQLVGYSDKDEFTGFLEKGLSKFNMLAQNRSSS